MTNNPDVIDGIRRGDRVALARAITILENRSAGYRSLAQACYRSRNDAWVIGITGSPGAGKSTLVDQLISSYRADNLRVGVIAVDPSSPYTGGSLLGDRVRMRSRVGDDGVFVRSMSTRGALGGVSPATADVIAAYATFGMDRIILETVGAGQNEVDVVEHADTVCVAVPPASGDDIQMLKAGILEIADIFVVNKMDLDGAPNMVTRLQEMRQLADPGDWDPPIVETIATGPSGIDALYAAIESHRDWAMESGASEDRRRARANAELERVVIEDLRARLEEVIEADDLDALGERILTGPEDPYSLAAELLDRVTHQSNDKHSEATGEH